MEPEADAMMEEPKEEMMGMAEEEIDEVEKKLRNGGFLCCCCLCQCTEEKIRDLTCCCFFPIRCGILFIGCIIIAITLFVFLEIFYELLNDDIHWWYVLVGVLLASTLVVASAFAVLFFTSDTHGSRVRLNVACMLVIIGVSLVAVWSTVYFVFLYKKDSVTTGNDGVGFVKATRKQEVVITLYVACCIDALFAYFICVVTQYIDAMKEPEEEMMMEEKKEEMMMMDDKMDAMMDDKMDPPMEEGEMAPMEGE
jgi:hypothetical protein